MESKNQNILLLALAGFGLYYFYNKKNQTAPVVPPTTGGGDLLPISPIPPREIITPVEPTPVIEFPISTLPKLTDPISDIISLPLKPIYVEPTPVAPTPPNQIITPVEPTPVIDLPIIDNPLPTPVEKVKPVEPTPVIDVPRKIITPVEPIYEEPISVPVPPASIWDEPIIDNPLPIAPSPIFEEPIYKAPDPIYREPSPIFDFPIYSDPVYQPEPIYDEPIYQPIDIPDAPIIRDDFYDSGYTPIENVPGGSGGSYIMTESIGSGGGIYNFIQNQVWLGNLNFFQAQSYESFDTIKADTSDQA